MKTLIHLTSENEGDAGHALRSASLMLNHDELSPEDVVVLPHRWGVKLFTPDSPLADRILNVLEKGVTVKLGATCFDANDLPREAIEGIEIVPSGVSESVRLQSEGDNYVKIP